MMESVIKCNPFLPIHSKWADIGDLMTCRITYYHHTRGMRMIIRYHIRTRPTISMVSWTFDFLHFCIDEKKNLESLFSTKRNVEKGSWNVFLIKNLFPPPLKIIFVIFLLNLFCLFFVHIYFLQIISLSLILIIDYQYNPEKKYKES